MPDVVLINPAWEGAVSRKGKRHNRRWPPLDLLNLAALLRAQGATVELVDARAVPTSPSVIKALASRADTAVITSSPLDRWQCPNLELAAFGELARGLEHPGLVVLGVHGTVDPAEVLRLTGARALVRGEPELAAAALAGGQARAAVPGAAWLAGGELMLGPEPRPVDLAGLPLPAFDLAPPHLYEYEVLGPDFALIETSRGCPFACRFCLKAMYGTGVRYKPLERVLAEVEAVARLGAKNFYFMDLEFTANRERVLELCAALEEMNPGLAWCCQTRVDTVDPELLSALAGAGCHLVHYGVESGSPAVLERLGKQITPDQARAAVAHTVEAGMQAACFFMLGFPGESDQDRAATLDLAKSLPAGLASFHLATPYPATGLAADCPEAEPWAEFDGEHFSREELEAWRRRAYLGFYLNPRRVAGLLKHGGPRLIKRGAKLLAGFLR
ncbi:MAG: B12-binding domain-containing radical SAM protein [Desulfarculaceae bacterium]|nr:B12-binding domain-containing radical SAM protein [Desulfarculaceae bacterium]MCF8073767.1 B12-binding domain-containing radical SAM protein [Desulfarculaceae bacterium]MCF8102008.1 B12-binding domain-containing radical SAM protein [Desulfarculaceae bacterium]MCF8115978.1 B12-binding domain-containing radical SAM protein [Desulfarculaceae bacterium]